MHDSTLLMMKQFVPLNGSLTTGYGLGLMRLSSGNTLAYGHNGNIRGFSSAMFYSPADSISISVLSNQSADLTGLTWSLLTTVRQTLSIAPGNVGNVRDALVCVPNPVQGNGQINYTLSKAQPIEITLQNSLGQTVQKLLTQSQPAGEHSLTVDTRSLAPGVYFCTLQTASSKLVQRWVVWQ
jgi:hypothetical protein